MAKKAKGANEETAFVQACRVESLMVWGAKAWSEMGVSTAGRVWTGLGRQVSRKVMVRFYSAMT